MDYSAANTALWSFILQFSVVAVSMVAANFLRRQIAFFRNSLLPTAVLGGFLLLGLRSAGVIALDPALLEMITYHGLAIAFIAMSLRVTPKSTEKGSMVGARS